MTHQRYRWAMVLLASAIGLTLLFLVKGLGMHNVPTAEDATPEFTWEPLTSLLRDHVRQGGVDYEGLVEDEALLRRQGAIVARYGPESTPELFTSHDERLAYHINAYNTLTLLGVVHHWPLESVQDVHGFAEPEAGFGFFYGMRFELDDSMINLYDLEHSVLRDEYEDARMHAAINCASRSCPELAVRPYAAATLDADLDAAARRFCSGAPHVVVTDEAIVLSAIFDWFAEDFVADAPRRGGGATVLDWVTYHAPAPLRQELEAARSANRPLRYADYDWSLNRAP